MSDQIDHVALGLTRPATQYRGKPDFSAYLTALLTPNNNIEQAMQDIESSFDIDVAEGTQLDLIGEIVGINRNVPDAYPLPFFGFEDTPEGLRYGDLIVGGGGTMWDLTIPRSTTWHLSDPMYRKFIRARILRNKSTGTLEDIIAILGVVFPSDGIIVSDVANQLAISVGLDRTTLPEENVILSYSGLIAKPAGVALIVLPYTAFVQYFGFPPTGATYGDLVAGGGGPFFEEAY